MTVARVTNLSVVVMCICALVLYKSHMPAKCILKALLLIAQFMCSSGEQNAQGSVSRHRYDSGVLELGVVDCVLKGLETMISCTCVETGTQKLLFTR